MSDDSRFPNVIRIASDAHRAGIAAEQCRQGEHPLDARRALGFDKNMKQTGTYCQQCGTVLERFKERR